jgi:hypothetical protein
MAGVRSLPPEEAATPSHCSRCGATGCVWDQIGGVAICPDCQETLICGEGEPIQFRLDRRACAACESSGTVAFVTVPLRAGALRIDLCPAHLRALLGRGLHRRDFLEICRQLQSAGLTPGQIFLLHEAFYDPHGKALQPVRIAG